MLRFEHKPYPPQALEERVALLTIPLVMTAGVLDLLNRGHVSYIAQARELGASLPVAINSDASTWRLRKAPGLPFNDCEDRAAMLAAFESTALTTWFAEDTAERVMLTVRSDEYAKGGDVQAQHTREGLLANRLCARAIVIDVLHVRSTSAIIHRVRSMGLR